MYDNNENNKGTSQKKSQPNYFIRIIVCAFILYLAYQIISDLVKNNFQQNSAYLLLTLAVIMALAAIFFIVISLRSMVQSGKKDLAEYERIKAEEALSEAEASDDEAENESETDK